jgi:xanthine dehydrogenase accessory factor
LKKLIQSLCHLLDDGEDLVVASILSRSGSAPRIAGTKMVIRASQDIVGTIGGGLVEARVQEAARDTFKTGETRCFAFDMSGLNAADMDMICGGQVEVLLEFVAANKENRTVFNAWHEALSTGRDCRLITPLPAGEQTVTPHERCLLHGDGICFGPVPLSDNIRQKLLQQTEGLRHAKVVPLEREEYFVEPCTVPTTLYLLGAGHVSQPTAALGSMVGFRTVVLDDREAFANQERFPEADDVRALPSFDGCIAALPIDRNSYVVIVSRGHMHDQDLLRQALQTEAGYIGMIGSLGKRDKIYANLRAEGFSQQVLDQVYSPIGLDIGAETPAEIAVSIIGELVRVRAAKQAHHD